MAYASPDSRAYRGSDAPRPPAPGRPSQRSPLAQPQPAPRPDDDDTISIADILENLLDHKWLFLLVVLLATGIAGGYALLATPIYTVDALIQVEDKKSSALGALSTVAEALNVSESPVEGEIEILRSRSNVTNAVEALGLQNEAEVENRLPLIGEWLSRRLERDDDGLAIAPALPLVGAGDWAWGGERLALATFEVPGDQYGRPHLLTIGEDERWTLENQEGRTVLAGRGDELVFDEANGYMLQLGEIVARPGNRFTVRHHSLLSRVEDIRRGLQVSETKRQSGIMRVQYPGPDPVAAAALVNALAGAYVAQNVQRRAAEADKSLQFLEEQLPTLRKQVESSEVALNAFRNRHQTIDIPGEIGALLAQSVELEKHRLELDLRRRDAQARYENAHPIAAALRDQIASVTTQQQRITDRIEALPSIQQEYLRLARDVEVNTQLYVSLLNNAQQLRVARAGTVANVSIVDPAVVSEKPARPRRALVAAVGLLGGVAGGFLLAQLLAALRGRVRDPAELEAALGIHVTATIPQSAEQQAIDRHRKLDEPYLLAQERPTAGAVEALRTLRLNLQLALADTEGGRTILLTSATPAQGKSFVAANLAWLIASAGQRVLLIDADIRRSSIERYLPLAGERGVSDILRERLDPTPFVEADAKPNLNVLPSGSDADNPGELLTEERLRHLFAWATAHYDIVIVDAPPILPVSDAVVLGRFADVTAFVVRQKKTAQADVAAAVQQYRLTGAPISGFVFNGFVPSRVRYGYGGRYGYHQGGYGYGARGRG